MTDLQFDRGYVNAAQAAAGRFGGGTPAPVPGETAGGEAAGSGSAGGEAAEFGFADFLDIINPLQHIPVVSTLYREITGDQISAPARIFGGTLFGGPSGFLSAMANTMFDEIAGQDLGASVLAFFDGDEGDDSQVASSAQPALSQAQRESMATVPLVSASGTLLNPVALNRAAARPMAPPPVPTQRELEDRGLLTGQDALDALFNDLRGPAAAAPELPAASTGAEPARAEEAPASPAALDAKQAASIVPAGTPAASGLHPMIGAAGGAAPAGNAALAEQMLTALDKYRAMTQQRQQQGAAASAGLPIRPRPPVPSGR